MILLDPRKIAEAGALIVGLLCFAIAGFTYCFWWETSWKAGTERIGVAREGIQRVQWIANHSAELERQFKQASSDQKGIDNYITEEDADHRDATLQRIVAQAAVRTGGRVVSAQPLPAGLNGEERTVAARFQISTSVAGLTQLLYLIDINRPFVFVDSADISSLGTQWSSAPEDSVQLQIDVHALLLPALHD